jgi:CelD/BcsL family acetyltransferase involved in cellulose biosynthesis
MDIIWLENEQEFRKIAPQWDAALRQSGADNPFLLSDFLLTWSKHFKGKRDLRIVAIFNDSQLIGGLPLYIEKESEERVLRFPGAIDYGVANYTDLLLNGRSVRLVIDALFCALERRKDWKLIVLDRLYNPSVDIGLLRECLELHRLLIIRQIQFPTLSIDVPDSLEEHLQHSGRKLRRNVRRAYRLAEKQGVLSLEIYRGKEQIESLYTYYVELSKASYEVRGSKSTFVDSQLYSFFHDLLVKFDELGILDAYALKLDDEIIAIGFCYSMCNNLNYILTAFDIRFDDLSPGHLLISELLKRAIDKRAPVMNFYTGGVFYKNNWTNRRERVFSLTIGRNTLGNRIRKRGRDLYSKIKSAK